MPSPHIDQMSWDDLPRPLALHGPYTPHVLACGLSERHASPPMLAHRLPCYLAMGATEGEQVLEVAGKQWPMAAGRLLVIPPGVAHRSWSPVPRRRLWIRFDVLFQPGRRSRAEALDCRPPDGWPGGAYQQPDPRSVWGVDLPDRPSGGLMDFALRLVERWHGPQPSDRFEADRLLVMLLGRLLRPQLDRVPPVAVDDRIAHAERIALTRLDQPFGVAGFAAAAQLSRTRFSELYHRLRGEPPSEFLARHRLARARMLLDDPAATVAEVASQCGFASASAFIHFVRRRTGLSPGAWRAADR